MKVFLLKILHLMNKNSINMSYFSVLRRVILRWTNKKSIFFKIKFYRITQNFLIPFFQKNNFIKLMTVFWPVKFSFKDFFWTKSTIPVKTKLTGLFLRKTKMFYKGRYARNRQTCRVIVFWTLSLNLLCIYGLYFYFYQFSYNFGYFWWGLLFLYFNLTWSNILKNSFYNPKNLVLEFIYFFRWIILLTKNLFRF